MSKFNVGDEVRYNNQEWVIIMPYLLGGWHLRRNRDWAIVTDDDIEMIKPAPLPITVYAVCDENGNYINETACHDYSQTESLRDQHHKSYTIRPATLTLTEVKQ